MKTLTVKLLQQYKSFEANTEFKIEGDLVLLTGINGSGKSQLLDVIYKREGLDKYKPISSQILLGDLVINNDNILLKSFKEYINIQELTPANVASISQAKNQIWHFYKDFQLNPDHQNARSYVQVCKSAKSLLIGKYGVERFNSELLTDYDIKNTIPDDFIFKQDDIFTNTIGEIFFNYVSKKYHANANRSITGVDFDESAFGVPPWIELNSLFEKLGFEYRFKSNYWRINEEINEQPQIYGLMINDKGEKEIDENQTRKLQDLSDGEKAIISFSFASLSRIEDGIKILLLDEYDATLNPSLIEAFFKILDIYFIQKDKMVIFTTHSTDTLMLAPEEANLYKMNRSSDTNRLESLDKNKYEEYKKIHDRHINDEENFRILTEGYNVKYVERALILLDPALQTQVHICSGIEDKSGKNQLKKAYELFSKTDSFGRILFVWDCDAEDESKNLMEVNGTYKLVFPKNDLNTKVKKGIENLFDESLFEDKFYKTKNRIDDYGAEQINKSFDKIAFCKEMMKKDGSVFSNFQVLVDKIKTIITPTSSTPPPSL